METCQKNYQPWRDTFDGSEIRRSPPVTYEILWKMGCSTHINWFAWFLPSTVCVFISLPNGSSGIFGLPGWKFISVFSYFDLKVPFTHFTHPPWFEKRQLSMAMAISLDESLWFFRISNTLGHVSSKVVMAWSTGLQLNSTAISTQNVWAPWHQICNCPNSARLPPCGRPHKQQQTSWSWFLMLCCSRRVFIAILGKIRSSP